MTSQQTVFPPFNKHVEGAFVDVEKLKARRFGSNYSKANDLLLIQPFFYDNIVWDGLSKIVRVFIITTNRPLAIVALPEKPSNPNYVPALSWKIAEGKAERFKLWNDVGEFLYAPLYRYQRIPQTFRLELWNVEDTSIVSQATTLQLLTSLLSLPTKYCGDGSMQAQYTLQDCVDGIIPMPLDVSIDPGLGDYWILPECGDAEFVNVADPEPIGEFFLLVENFED